MVNKQAARKQHSFDYRADREAFMEDLFDNLPHRVLSVYCRESWRGHEAAYDDAFKFARKNGMVCGEPGIPAHEGSLRFLFDFEV